MKTSALLALVFGAALIRAADYPAPVEGDWVVRDFRFHTGETLPELRLHYITVGARTGEPVSDSAWHQRHRPSISAPGFCRRAFRTGPAARRRHPLHHSAGCHRGGEIVQAFRRIAHAFSAVRL